MDSTQFWNEARRRRNIFFLIGAGWLLGGFPLFFFYERFLPSSPLPVAGFAAIFTWMAVMSWAALSVTNLRCFRCGGQAFSNPYFFMKDAKCQSCGVSFGGT